MSETDQVGLENWMDFNGIFAPQAPDEISDSGFNEIQLSELTLKIGATTTQFTTEWASQKTCLPAAIVEELCWSLKDDQLVEVIGQAGPLNYRYALTDRGRDHAKRLMMISGYVGPAPVSLPAYTNHLLWESHHHPPVQFEQVENALSDIVLTEDAVEVAALAASSGRSLFLFGPPGNGKTTISRLLHHVYSDTIWIPHAIQVDSSLVRIFDPQVHEVVEIDDPNRELDHRWVQIKRPFVLVGGELAIEDLDLKWSESRHYYEAPPHMKANGGTFVIDDFGRQRMDPSDLLNRWIVPLETRMDYLALHTGQRMEVPFEMMLIVATNLRVEDVADPAFLRRMGYRFHVHAPTEDLYREIFVRFSNRSGMDVEPSVLDDVMQRYTNEKRDLRASEAGELIQRCQDICALHDFPKRITSEVMGKAWQAYFGNQ